MPSRDAGACLEAPASAQWIPTNVPGNVTAAPNGHGESSGDLHSFDHWFRLDMSLPAGAWLEFGGLATLAEIWIDGRLVANSDTMFVPLIVDVPTQGGSRLDICFRALRPALRRRLAGRRPRWLGRLATEERLRGQRTTLLGHMPGWSGSAPVIGPFRAITLNEPKAGAPVITRVNMRVRLLPNGDGLISVRLDGSGLAGRTGVITAAGHSVELSPAGDGLQAELTIANPQLWWPHTHGVPETYAVTGKIGSHDLDFGRVGFRTLVLRDPAAGFGLLINGSPVFCRGAIWTGLDPSALPSDPAALAACKFARNTDPLRGGFRVQI